MYVCVHLARVSSTSTNHAQGYTMKKKKLGKKVLLAPTDGFEPVTSHLLIQHTTKRGKKKCLQYASNLVPFVCQTSTLTPETHSIQNIHYNNKVTYRRM